MTPAIQQAKRAKIPFHVHEYAHDPRTEAYGLEAAQALGLDPAQVFKTLLVTLNGDRKKLAVGIVPVELFLNLKQMAAALGVKTVDMANPKDAERSTGYIVGASALLGKRLLPTVLDDSALQFANIFVSGGRRGLDIELAPADLLALCNGVAAPIARER
ncbi:MAG: Cys-tRNA(Pro) deacylase [Candidatus Thiothrix singaporensis]|uniref:Cys-tRNA(Pro)/Cys-tRNA(Cys) deacylase n=1 Tax=Candidatus Thiothrix singaporensis TaxID=2799669 RepID=A0A7L6AQ69_9GAMM|nr:MAG: Cys-tRNA(Pro) deacylase [Candidatus Thiothrix singaporensis]